MKKRLRQREFGFTNWGGKRKGAGRKPKGAKAMASHAKRERLEARHPVFVTMRLRVGLRSLRANDTHALLEAGRVFEDRYHARILTTPSAVRNALVYVLNNAREHGAWFAKSLDVYSSGPAFDGWRAALSPAISRSRLLPSSRTWLLSVGWKRHGLLGVLETPKEESRSFKPRHRRR
jgi:REP-associated tyrosine transposase